MTLRPTPVNIVRILLVVLAIIVLLVGTLSSIDPHTVQFAILPFVYLFFASILAIRLAPLNVALFELAGSSQLVSARAPPVS